MINIRHILVRPAIALLAVVFMACHCEEPLPPTPPPPEPPVDETSEDLKAFLKKTDFGLYVDARGVVTYDELLCQKAWNPDGGSFRIQRDDQTAYLCVRSSAQSASSSYQVEYMTGGQDVTLMLIKLQSVKTENSAIWLWNETMKTGIIIPAGIL